MSYMQDLIQSAARAHPVTPGLAPGRSEELVALATRKIAEPDKTAVAR
ncbi:hypothetical protein [Breoghania sp.]|nr:hypothetical protein [Breoghania sp.]MDJ0933368.1 hypothetical protein [Breoghania sp.]